MAEIYVTNSLSTSKSVKFNVGLRYFVVKGDRDGDNKWVLEIGTTHSGSDGTTPLVKKIHGISSENLDEVFEDAISELCEDIDWSPFVNDGRDPYMDSYSPSGDNVSIGSIVYMYIKDNLPSAGIDLSNVKITLNNGTTNFDITSEVEVTGDPYEYQLKWSPPRIA